MPHESDAHRARLRGVHVVFALLAAATLGLTPAEAPAHEAGPSTSGPVTGSGARGPDVEALQSRLAELRYDPGAVDGAFGQATRYAVIAFQKVHGLSPTGRVGDAEWDALASPAPPAPLRPDGGADRVEVDLARQLMFAYRGGGLELITHVSTGNGEYYCLEGECRYADTPVGDHRFLRYVPGWDHNPLGSLYNSVYLTDTGVAVHGSSDVPLHPASHGCIRIPLHTAEWFPSLVHIGEPVYVVG